MTTFSMVRGDEDRRAADRRLLRTIDTFIRDRGYSPSLRELRDLCQYSSVSVVSAAVRRLEKLGAIGRGPAGTSRSLTVLDGGLGEE